MRLVLRGLRRESKSYLEGLGGKVNKIRNYYKFSPVSSEEK